MSLAIYAGDAIDRDPVTHDTRDWLRRSKSAIKAGYLIEGAALLQKGVRVFLDADLDYWGVRPKGRSLVEMAKAIWLAGHATRDSYAVLASIISEAENVVRCRPTEGDAKQMLLSGVQVMDSFCNGSVYLNEGSQS